MHRDSGRAQARALDDVVAALEHHRSGQCDAARLVYWKSLRRGVIDSRIPYLMACLEIHADKPEKATDWFCKAIRREMHKGRAAPPNGDGIPDGFTGALVFDPQPVHTCRQLSLALHARGERQLATLALKAWLAYVPADPRALALVGEVADHSTDHELAYPPSGQYPRL